MAVVGNIFSAQVIDFGNFFLTSGLDVMVVCRRHWSAARAVQLQLVIKLASTFGRGQGPSLAVGETPQRIMSRTRMARSISQANVRKFRVLLSAENVTRKC